MVIKGIQSDRFLPQCLMTLGFALLDGAFIPYLHRSQAGTVAPSSEYNFYNRWIPVLPKLGERLSISAVRLARYNGILSMPIPSKSFECFLIVCCGAYSV